MKKVMLVLATGLLLMTSAAAAEPIKITGEVSAKYQRDTVDKEAGASGSVYTVKIMSEADLGSGFSLYARLGAQGVTVPSLSDFNLSPEVYGENKKSVAALDQFGLNYKTESLTYRLGRQDATIGTTALLYSRPDSNIGKKAFVDGLAVSGTIGKVDIAALAAREDNPTGELKNKVYAVRAGYSPVDNLNWGITLGRYASDASTNHWAVDGTYKFGKSYLTAEYTKASSNTNNKAYAVVLGYDFDDKITASITGFRVEEFGSMGQQSDFDFDNRGFHYGLGYKLSDNAGLELIYKSPKTISDDKKNTSFEATLNYTF